GQPRRGSAAGQRARKVEPLLVVALYRYVPRASDQLGDAGAVHDLVAEAWLRVDQDRLAVERLALPFGERKLAVAADEVLLAPPQLEAFPALGEARMAQPADGEVVADVGVIGRDLQRRPEQRLGLRFASGQIQQNAFRRQREGGIRIARQRLVDAGKRFLIAHLVAKHHGEIHQQRDVVGARLEAVAKAPLGLFDLVLVAQDLADLLQCLGALRLQAQRLLETRHRRGGSALLAQREPEGDERG